MLNNILRLFKFISLIGCNNTLTLDNKKTIILSNQIMFFIFYAYLHIPIFFILHAYIIGSITIGLTLLIPVSLLLNTHINIQQNHYFFLLHYQYIFLLQF